MSVGSDTQPLRMHVIFVASSKQRMRFPGAILNTIVAY